MWREIVLNVYIKYKYSNYYKWVKLFLYTSNTTYLFNYGTCFKGSLPPFWTVLRLLLSPVGCVVVILHLSVGLITIALGNFDICWLYNIFAFKHSSRISTKNRKVWSRKLHQIFWKLIAFPGLSKYFEILHFNINVYVKNENVWKSIFNENFLTSLGKFRDFVGFSRLPNIVILHSTGCFTILNGYITSL